MSTISERHKRTEHWIVNVYNGRPWLSLFHAHANQAVRGIPVVRMRKRELEGDAGIARPESSSEVGTQIPGWLPSLSQCSGQLCHPAAAAVVWRWLGIMIFTARELRKLSVACCDICLSSSGCLAIFAFPSRASYWCNASRACSTACFFLRRAFIIRVDLFGEPKEFPGWGGESPN